jgi:hypothetical protein
LEHTSASELVNKLTSAEGRDWRSRPCEKAQTLVLQV